MAEAPDTSNKRLEELEEEITCAVCRGHYMPWDDLCITGTPGYSVNGFAAVFIAGLPWDGLCITGTPGYWVNGFAVRESSFG